MTRVIYLRNFRTTNPRQPARWLHNERKSNMPLNSDQQKRRLTDRAHTVGLASDVRDAVKKLEQVCHAAAEWANAQHASTLPGVHRYANGNAIRIAARQATAHGAEAQVLVEQLADAIDASVRWDDRRSDAFPPQQHRAIA